MACKAKPGGKVPAKPATKAPVKKGGKKQIKSKSRTLNCVAKKNPQP